MGDPVLEKTHDVLVLEEAQEAPVNSRPLNTSGHPGRGLDRPPVRGPIVSEDDVGRDFLNVQAGVDPPEHSHHPGSRLLDEFLAER